MKEKMIAETKIMTEELFKKD